MTTPNSKTTEQTPDKEAYEKPLLRKIELFADEVICGFCKGTGSLGPEASDCALPGGCAEIGS